MRKRLWGALAALLALGVCCFGALSREGGGLPASTERVTREVALSPLSRVMIQLDLCETEAEARLSAARMLRNGSAGYIYPEGGFRVLAAMAETGEEAERICERLRETGIPCAAYPVRAQGARFSLAARPDQIEAVTAAVRALDMAATEPEAAARRLDAGETDAAGAKAVAAMLRRDCEQARLSLSETGAEGALPEALTAALSEAERRLGEAASGEETSPRLRAGMLRHAGMACWFLRAALTRETRP